jgi:hypothetical protein
VPFTAIPDLFSFPHVILRACITSDSAGNLAAFWLNAAVHLFVAGAQNEFPHVARAAK